MSFRQVRSPASLSTPSAATLHASREAGVRSTIAAVEEMRASERTPPKLGARVYGKVLHQGVTVPFVAVAAASIFQLMHKRESGPLAHSKIFSICGTSSRANLTVTRA